MKLAPLFNKLIGKRTGEGVFSLDEHAEISGFRPIWVVSRQQYRERVKHYPIDNLKELRKVLSLRTSEPETLVLTKVCKAEDDGYQVKDFLIPQNLFNDQQQRPMMVLPEGEVVAACLDNDQAVEVVSDDTRYFLLNQQRDHLSALKRGNVTSLDLFLVSQGTSADSVTNKGELQLADTSVPVTDLLRTIITASWSWLPMTAERWRSWLISPVVYSAAAFSVYLVLSSAYVFMNLKSVESRFEDNLEQMNQTLSVTRSLDQQRERFDKSSALLGDFQHSSAIWKVLLPLFEDGVQIVSIEYLADGYIVSGEHGSASDTLAKLQNSRMVAQAAFNSPVVSRRNKEAFSVRLTLNQDAMTSEEVLANER